MVSTSYPRRTQQVILFSGPEDTDSSPVSEANFGHKLDPPEPFGCTLDTAPFAG